MKYPSFLIPRYSDGGELVKVRPHCTSQTCSSCGHVEKGNRLNESFECLMCNYFGHADINAARNILALGHRATVCGEMAIGRSMKQKPKGA